MYTRIQGNEGKKQRTKTNEKKKMGTFHHWLHAQAHTAIEPNEEVPFRREHAVHTIHANETLMNGINNKISAHTKSHNLLLLSENKLNRNLD